MRPWTASDITMLRKWTALASMLDLTPGYVANRARHSAEECDYALWIGLGRGEAETVELLNGVADRRAA